MKRLFFLFSLLLGLVPSAFATDHRGIDQWGHLVTHLQLAWLALTQGHWDVLFYQGICSTDPVMKLLYEHGGAIMLVIVFTIVMTMRYLWRYRGLFTANIPAFARP